MVDDFLFDVDSSAKCAADLNAFIQLCGLLGVPLAQGKTQHPDSTLLWIR